MNQSKNVSNQEKSKNDTAHAKTLKADIVVIGAGSSGLSAALTAAAQGAQVILLEKMPFPGGYSLMAEGMFAAESILQKRENIGVTADEAFQNHMESTHWNADARLVKAFIDRSAATIDWLIQIGVEFDKVWTLWPGGPRTWHLVKGGGKALIQTLAKNVMEKGVQMFTGTPVVNLIMDNENRVSGVIAQNNNGESIKVDTRAVIIAGGSFASNKEMIKEFSGITCEVHTMIDMQQTGEPIRMAWDVGAAQRGANVLLIIPALKNEKPDSHLWAAAIQPQLWVNLDGERFCDEATAFQFPFMANALANQKEGILYNIFDETTKLKLINEGIDSSVGVFVPATTKLDRLEADLKRGIEEGKVFAADSIPGLADKINVDRDTLKETIAEYNKCCHNKYDSTLAKSHRFLRPVEKPTFYAVKCFLHIFTTLGGIKINHKTEVLDVDFKPIPGLYAVGNCAGGMYNRDYDVVTCGGALGFAINSGRIAAENSLKYIGK